MQAEEGSRCVLAGYDWRFSAADSWPAALTDICVEKDGGASRVHARKLGEIKHNRVDHDPQIPRLVVLRALSDGAGTGSTHLCDLVQGELPELLCVSAVCLVICHCGVSLRVNVYSSEQQSKRIVNRLPLGH